MNVAPPPDAPVVEPLPADVVPLLLHPAAARPIDNITAAALRWEHRFIRRSFVSLLCSSLFFGLRSAFIIGAGEHVRRRHAGEGRSASIRGDRSLLVRSFTAMVLHNPTMPPGAKNMRRMSRTPRMTGVAPFTDSGKLVVTMSEN